MADTTAAGKYDVVLDRTFDAPRNLVWQAWTDTAMLQQWWGPAHFSNQVFRADVRPGGSIYVEMRSPDGKVYPMRGTYHEIVEPERIVFRSGALDAEGKLLFEILATVTFADVAGKTALKVELKVISETTAAPQYLVGMRQGWIQMLDRIAEFTTTGRVAL